MAANQKLSKLVLESKNSFGLRFEPRGTLERLQNIGFFVVKNWHNDDG